MADEDILKRICDETGASLDEALFYLEGFNWDSVEATEACRQKILPPVKVKSSPEVSVNVKSDAEESLTMIDSRRIRFPSEPARMMDSCQSSNQSQWQEPPHETQKEFIDIFLELAPELSPQEANDPPVFDRRHIPMTGVSNSAGFSSQDETSAALAMDVKRQRAPPLRLLPSESQLDASTGYPKQGQIGSSSSCSMNVQSGEEYIPVPITYSSQVQMESSSPLPPSRSLVIGSRRIQPEQLPPEQEQLSAEEQNERILTVCEATKMSPQVALSYLKRCKWNTNNTINDSSGNLNSLRILEEDHSAIGQSNSQWTLGDVLIIRRDRSTIKFSEDVSSRALASMRLQNIPPPVPSMGSPSQSQFQAPESSSSRWSTYVKRCSETIAFLTFAFLAYVPIRYVIDAQKHYGRRLQTADYLHLLIRFVQYFTLADPFIILALAYAATYIVSSASFSNFVVQVAEMVSIFLGFGIVFWVIFYISLVSFYVGLALFCLSIGAITIREFLLARRGI